MDDFKFKPREKVYYVYKDKVCCGKIQLRVFNSNNCGKYYHIEPCDIYMLDIPEELVFVNEKDARKFCNKRNKIMTQLRDKIIEFLEENNISYSDLDNEISVDLLKCADEIMETEE